ncbi:hypothetical protein ACFQLZ_05805 [Halospeciosus flavus]
MTPHLDGAESDTVPTTSTHGSSVYGGRPTFALSRRDDQDGGAVTLYELLPKEQANARHDRLSAAVVTSELSRLSTCSAIQRLAQSSSGPGRTGRL